MRAMVLLGAGIEVVADVQDLERGFTPMKRHSRRNSS